MNIHTEPEDGKNPVLEIIRESQKFLHLNYYLIDDPEFMKAIEDRVSHKVNVQIIIDGEPYEGSSHSSLEALRRTGAQVNLSPSRFDNTDVFDHAKYMYNEKRFLIGTMNLTDAAFKSNREYFVIGGERKVLKSLASIFESDWKGERAGEVDRKDLIVSPDSENRILGILRDGKKLFIETEELGNDRVILDTLKTKGKKLRMILPSSISDEDMNNADELMKNGAKIRVMPAEKLYMHAKMIHTGKFVFIGSQNFSSTSLLKNREVGIMVKKYGMKKIFNNKFKEDWKNSETITRKMRKGAKS